MKDLDDTTFVRFQNNHCSFTLMQTKYIGREGALGNEECSDRHHVGRKG